MSTSATSSPRSNGSSETETPMVAAISRLAAAIDRHIQERKRQVLIYDHDLKCLAALFFGLPFEAVDLPYEEWAAIRANYRAQTEPHDHPRPLPKELPFDEPSAKEKRAMVLETLGLLVPAVRAKFPHYARSKFLITPEGVLTGEGVRLEWRKRRHPELPESYENQQCRRGSVFLVPLPRDPDADNQRPADATDR